MGTGGRRKNNPELLSPPTYFLDKVPGVKVSGSSKGMRPGRAWGPGLLRVLLLGTPQSWVTGGQGTVFGVTFLPSHWQSPAFWLAFPSSEENHKTGRRQALQSTVACYDT